MATLAYGDATGERLLRLLAEQLKLPLLQIARQAELAAQQQDYQKLDSIQHTADMALRLLDSYLLSVRLQSLPTLALEPVSVSAVLADTAHYLSQLAKQYDCEIEVHLGGKYRPVMAHRASLEAALATLGYAFIEAAPDNTGRHRLILSVDRRSGGLATGVFGDQAANLNADALRRGRALFGTAQQPLPNLSASSGAGVFVADALLSQMNAPLHIARHNKLTGLAATLLPSQQLALV